MIRILVTGSRTWADADAIAAGLDDAVHFWGPGPVTLVSGACPRGADRLAEQHAKMRGWTVERHPANWDLHRKAAGFIRNQAMADLGATALVAFSIGNSPGTRDMIRRAEKAGIPTVVHEGEERVSETRDGRDA